ncbi:MAG: hypothetical protein IJ863_04990 [Spirochaetales bacterium]|nr:hypothetical protein [Spirochaetales bacterium]
MKNNGTQRANGDFSFLRNGDVCIREKAGNMTREPWLMLMTRRNQEPTKTLCWGVTNNGSSFARIGTQEGDLVNGFVHEDPYKCRQLGSFIYIKEGNDYFTDCWYPVLHKDQELTTTYSFGCVTRETSYLNLYVTTRCFIPDEYDAMVQLVTVVNRTDRDRKIQVFGVNPMNVGDARALQFSGFNSMMMAGGFPDRSLNGLVWYNGYGIPFDDDEDTDLGMFGKVLLHGASRNLTQFSMRYEDFVGHYTRTMANPIALETGVLPCAPAQESTSSLSVVCFEVEVPANGCESFTIFSIAGSTENYYHGRKQELKKAVATLSDTQKVEKMLSQVIKDWNEDFNRLRFRVPGNKLFAPSFRWLQYQCAMVLNLNRMKSRFHSGFEYGFGFRDILQDILAGLASESSKTRAFIKYIGEQMFSDGSAYHNFYVSAPGTLDFHACDDPIWFIFAVCEYVKETGDTALLEEVIPYADAKENRPERSGSILDHCIMALDQVWTHSRDGIPTMFDADWNDDLSGFEDHGSVMAAMMLYKAYMDFAELCDFTGRAKLAEDAREKAGITQNTLRTRCIDSSSAFIRLVSPDGDRSKDVGSADSDGRLFLEPTSWALFSNAVSIEEFRASQAVVERKLAAKGGIALCTADFTLSKGKAPVDYTAFKRNAPGKKENGSFFRHTESWFIASLCYAGEGTKAWKYFYSTLPAVCSKDDPFNYAAEPFVFPEYVCSPASRDYGRAGHTWLTGTAPTRERVLCENIFGIRPTYTGLEIDPCVPSGWKSFTAVRNFRGTEFSIRYNNPLKVERGVKSISVDGKDIDGNIIPLSVCDGKKHFIEVRMG